MRATIEGGGAMSEFERDTAIAQVGVTLFEGRVSPAWWVGRGPNGGFVTALFVRALEATLPAPELAARSLTVHFVAPMVEGPCQIATRIERVGRTLTSLSARMTQGDHLCALALAAYARSRTSLTYSEGVMPAPPATDALLVGLGRFVPPAAERYEFRGLLGDPPFSGSSRAEVGGWIRLKDPSIADTALVAAFTDAWYPAPFPRLTAPIGAPTIDLTIHFRANLPLQGATADDFYLGVFRSRLAAEGFFEEDGELWSKDGVLIAQSRQLAMLPTARE